MGDVMNHARQVSSTIAPQWDYYAAFTVAVLGEMLPEGYGSFRNPYGWVCDSDEDPSEMADTEADARAKMLIYLIEKHLVDVSALNTFSA